MKTLVSMLALALVMAFSAPAFAAPKTQVACEKAGSNRQEVLEGNVVSCGAKEGGGTGARRSHA